MPAPVSADTRSTCKSPSSVAAALPSARSTLLRISVNGGGGAERRACRRDRRVERLADIDDPEHAVGAANLGVRAAQAFALDRIGRNRASPRCR